MKILLPLWPLVHLGVLFAVAWRNYVKQVFRPGFMYRVSEMPHTLLYVSSNKTLAGKYDRSSEGEAAGRKNVATFFEGDGPGRAQPVD